MTKHDTKQNDLSQIFSYKYTASDNGLRENSKIIRKTVDRKLAQLETSQFGPF